MKKTKSKKLGGMKAAGQKRKTSSMGAKISSYSSRSGGSSQSRSVKTATNGKKSGSKKTSLMRKPGQVKQQGARQSANEHYH